MKPTCDATCKYLLALSIVVMILGYVFAIDTLWVSTETKYKFLAEVEGDKAQLERFYNSCKGVPQVQTCVV